tara:strand:- start:838 stop:1221 length:384 start_codon:yes stop_codon:yes gene_type:complete
MNITRFLPSECSFGLAISETLDELYLNIFPCFYANAMYLSPKKIKEKIEKAFYYKTPISITVAKSHFNEHYQATPEAIALINKMVEQFNAKHKVKVNKINIPGVSDVLLSAKGNDTLSKRITIDLSW